jgi:hypothetical protein
MNGNQFMMFNILERRFNILDFRLAAGYLFIRAFYDCGVVFVVILLRLFWKNILWMDLSQTIFLEMVFRRIEFWIEGDRASNQIV